MAFGINSAKAAVKRRRKRVKVRRHELRGAERKLEQAKQALVRARAARDEAAQWAHCRGVTNEIIRIVDGRARVTSRKRPANHPLSLANPSSDHNEANPRADAVDFGIVEAHSLKNEIIRKLTHGRVQSVTDFTWVDVNFEGDSFRVQPIAGTHGTGPHMHWGVERLA